MKIIVKPFAEIAIKSRPVRKQFIRQLGKNLRAVLKDLDPTLKVEGEWDNLDIDIQLANARALTQLRERLRCIPGIANSVEVNESRFTSFDDVYAQCLHYYGATLPGKTFAVRCRRVGKHDFSSVDLATYVGSRLRRECGAAGIDLKNPDIEVRIELRGERLFIVGNRHEGMGGYPLGALEQSLVLMSGGFDSSVAAYQMMRRGLLSHFCFFNLGGRAHELGVMEVAHYLWKKYSSSHRVLFISVPFEEVVSEILQNVDDSYMGVVLKRTMLKIASRLADELDIDTLVTGEAISQVASQTLTNLRVIDLATEKLVVRPLVATHKQEIIDTATDIGTAVFARHMPEYCGVISVNPSTRAKLMRAEYEERQLSEAVLERALARARRVTIDRVIEELGKDVPVEEVHEVLSGQIVLDIRHPNEVEDNPLHLPGIDVHALPFYAINQRFTELDASRQYLLYCDRGVMSRLHAHHLLNEGHANVRVYRPQ